MDIKYDKELVTKFEKWCNENCLSHSIYNFIIFLSNKGLINIERVIEFIDDENMPKLTKDEKIILQNIDTINFYIIGRKNGYLYLKGDDGKDKEIFWYLYHDLFQTIKEGKEYKISDLLKSEAKKVE